MATRTPGVWGIDLGQCALKAIRLEMKDGQPVATAFEYIEHPKILSQPDADPDELTADALNQFLERNNIRGDIVAISVPGQSGLARFVKLPPVDEKKIADIVKFEAKQQIPFPLEEVVWDFQRLNKGDIIDGLALETEIGLFAMKRDMVNRAINQFKKVNVEVHYVQMAPLALANFVSYDLLDKSAAGVDEEGEESLDCIVCMEIGTDSSNLVITNGGRIIWQRPIPIGGNHFTRALTKEMKLTFAKAEHLKRNAAKSPDLKKILSSLKQVLNDFVGEVQRSLGYFTNTHRNAQIQYMIGLGNAFRLPGLQKFLQEKLQLEVRKFQKLERTTGETVTTAPTFAENIMSFGVAYGLALQGLGQSKLQTNLLPPEVTVERVIRAKKPWVLTAAASLLFGMFILAFARGMEQGAVNNDEIDKGKKALEDAVKIAKKYDGDFTLVDQNLRNHIDNLNRIGAGINERLNWQLLHQYINLATPQPNGDRLALTSPGRLVGPKDTYWTNDKNAQDAFRRYDENRFNPKAAENRRKAMEDERFIKKHLIQINIVGINALYTDDMLGYFKRIYSENNRLTGMLPKDREKVISAVTDADPAKADALKLPKKGWVVELRGYTYHHKEDFFVEHTLLENLQFPQPIVAVDEKEKKAAAELKSRVQDRVFYLHLYKILPVKDPIPGQFQVISKGVLAGLLRSGAAVGKEGVVPPIGNPPMANPMGDAPPAADGQAKPAGAARDAWRPIGEVASKVMGDGVGAVGGAPRDMQPPMPVMPPPNGFVPMPIPGQPKLDPQGRPIQRPDEPKRTEFILLFVWNEPILTQETALGEEPGDNAAPPPAVPPPAKE